MDFLVTSHTFVWLYFPMNLREIPNALLLSRAQSLAQKERTLSLEVLQHLREIERRSLYAERGYPSLFEYAVQELK
jgi:hypothetical protein